MSAGPWIEVEEPRPWDAAEVTATARTAVTVVLAGSVVAALAGVAAIALAMPVVLELLSMAVPQ